MCVCVCVCVCVCFLSTFLPYRRDPTHAWRFSPKTTTLNGSCRTTVHTTPIHEPAASRNYPVQSSTKKLRLHPSLLPTTSTCSMTIPWKDIEQISICSSFEHHCFYHWSVRVGNADDPGGGNPVGMAANSNVPKKQHLCLNSSNNSNSQQQQQQWQHEQQQQQHRQNNKHRDDPQTSIRSPRRNFFHCSFAMFNLPSCRCRCCCCCCCCCCCFCPVVVAVVLSTLLLMFFLPCCRCCCCSCFFGCCCCCQYLIFRPDS